MPPFGEQRLLTASLRSSSSFLKNHVECEQGGILKEMLMNQSLPADLVRCIRDILERSSNLETKMMMRGGDYALSSTFRECVENSIRETLTDISDYLAGMPAMQDPLLPIWLAILHSRIRRSRDFLCRIELPLSEQGSNQALGKRLQDFFVGNCADGPRGSLVVSKLSSSLSFEYKAGNTEMKTVCLDNCSNSFHVSLTPYFLLRSEHIEEAGGGLSCVSARKKNRCKIKIHSCSYRKEIDTPSSSGTVGEAIIRVHIALDGDTTNGTTWSPDNRVDCSKFRVVEVRSALQQNDSTCFDHQARWDLFVSSEFGSPSITVTMKTRTFALINKENPLMDMQIILEPPRA